MSGAVPPLAPGTSGDSSGGKTSGANIGIIVGAVAGGMCLLAVVAAAIFYAIQSQKILNPNYPAPAKAPRRGGTDGTSSASTSSAGRVVPSYFPALPVAYKAPRSGSTGGAGVTAGGTVPEPNYFQPATPSLTLILADDGDEGEQVTTCYLPSSPSQTPSILSPAAMHAPGSPALV